MHDRLDVVSWEESGDAVTDTFEPAVIVFLDNVDDGSLHEGQFILLVLAVVIDGHNWEKKRKLSSRKCKPTLSRRILDGQAVASPVANLSLSKPWGPTGGLRQSRDRCNEPLRHPLPHSPQVGEEEEGRALQTHQCPLGEAEEAGRGCLLLNEDRQWRRKRMRKNLKEKSQREAVQIMCLLS